MFPKPNVSRDPRSWRYKNISKEREKLLRKEISFEQIVVEILKGRVCTEQSKRPEVNSSALRSVSTAVEFPVNTCKRIVISLEIEKDIHDIFVNGVSGLFAKYFQSVQDGRDAMAAVIKAVKESTEIQSAKSQDKEVEHFWGMSLDEQYGIVWLDEDEFPNERYKRGQIMILGPARPRIVNDFWPARPVFSAGKRLIIKGAWVGPENEIAIADSKANLHETLTSRGFS